MYKKMLSFFMLIAIYIQLAGLTAYAYEEKTLRVGIPIPVENDDSASSYYGYTQEYLHEIAQYTDWKYEFITVSGDYDTGLNGVFDMLKSGEIDLAAPVVINEEAAHEGIYFSQSSYLTTKLELQVPSAVYRGQTLTENMTVAIIKGSGQKNSADEFFSRNNITADYLVCKNTEEQIEAVSSGRADVMINSTLEYIPDMTAIARFSPSELYFAAGDADIMEKLNQANINIMQSNVLYSQELYEKYVMDSSQMLTPIETEFIESSKPYTVAVLQDDGPYQSVQDGEYKGIGVDLLKYIGENTGLQFNFITAKSRDELKTLIENNEVQIVAAVSYNHSWAENLGVTLTRNYASAPYVLVAHRSL